MHRNPALAPSRPGRTIVGLAGIAILGIGFAFIGRSETVAAFTDPLWGGAFFETAPAFGIQSSEIYYNNGFGDHLDDPVAMAATPVQVAPGGVSYAAVYLRMTPGTEGGATVSMSQPEQGSSNADLWDDYITYRARSGPAVFTTECNDGAFDTTKDGTWIIENPTTLGNTPSNPGSFEIPQSGKVMVCFEFTLDPAVVTGAPSANGQSVTPIWRFSAEPQS